jgi:hypothetical protein
VSEPPKLTSAGDPLNQQLVQFSYLQALDFLTTVAFMMHGVQEGNPLVRMAMAFTTNPLSALLFVKLAAIMLGIYCWRVRRSRLLLRMNVLFAVVVAWNLVALIVSAVRV